MKRLALYIIMCLAATSMSGSWHYEENNTFIASADEYISGDYDQPTTLAIYVVSHRGVNGVVGGIFGEYCIHDFRPSQQYVMIDFGQGRERWKVRPFEVNGTAESSFIFDDPDALIRKLCEAESFTVTLPLYRVGTHTFYFNADGYPLDF